MSPSAGVTQRGKCVCVVWKDVGRGSCELLGGNTPGAHGAVFRLGLDTW